MNIKEKIIKKLEEVVKELTKESIKIQLSIPNDDSHGDYSSNIAMQIFARVKRQPSTGNWGSPLELATEIAEKFQLSFRAKQREVEESRSIDADEKDPSTTLRMTSFIEKVETVPPGFINFYLSKEALIKNAEEVLKNPEKVAITSALHGKRLMVEYAHPNTHKEAHIGHTRTLMTGESIARILEANDATVFRANYQGDVGPHVAKAVYGIQKMLDEDKKTLDDFEKYTNFEKVHFLGMAYARGNQDYEAEKEEIDGINKLIYLHGEGNATLWEIYQRTRKWSLDYYEDLYKLFGVKFDRLFFESEMAEEGPRIVKANIGKVFVQDPDGSIYFPGEKYGLHTRVFVTKAGTPTYEGKEMANAMMEAKEFPFDSKIHIVGSEQEGYFQVVFKALELIDPEKFVGKQIHIPTGIIQLKGKKMSSRTGDVLTYNQLIDEVKEHIAKLFEDREITEDVSLNVALGAIKYSVLKGGTRQNVIFDMEKSISLQGDSGPYVQYSYTRTQSILHKAGISNIQFPISQPEVDRHLDESTTNVIPGSDQESIQIEPGSRIKYGMTSDYSPNSEELKILRLVQKFPEIMETAATTYSPNMVTEYLFQLSQLFNNFYQKYRILNAPNPYTPDVKGPDTSGVTRDFRLALTATVGLVLKQGLSLLGIAAPEKM